MKTKCTSKVLSLILVMLMLIGMTPAVVSAAQTDVTSDGYKYSISNGEVTITGYTGVSTVVNIPKAIEKCPVTKVSSYAFTGNTDITVVVYPKGVTAVEEISFANCKSLASVHLPDTIVAIRGSAFFGCTKLVNISIPENVEVIGNSAFQKCGSLTNITLPDSVKSIGGLAFAECSKLKTINIPEGITTIAESTFEKCTSLKTVKIPATVTSIDQRAFSYCSSLSDVYFGGTSKQWNAVEIGANNGYLRSATIHCQETSEEMFNIFFSSNRNWNGVYIYGYYGSDINNPTAEPLGAYPGEKMTWVRVNDYAQNEYYATVPADVDGIVFSSGDGIYRTVEIPNDVLYNNIVFYLKEKTGDYFDYGTAYYPCRETELTYDLGDANEDGRINIRDANAIIDAINGLAELSEIGRVAADVNEDGIIDIADVYIILDYIAGILTVHWNGRTVILENTNIPEIIETRCFTVEQEPESSEFFEDGTTEEITIRFKNAEREKKRKWENVLVYYWGSYGECAAWPGVEMPYTSTYMYTDGVSYDDIYEITLPAGTEGVIFHNNDNIISETLSAQRLMELPANISRGYYLSGLKNSDGTYRLICDTMILYTQYPDTPENTETPTETTPPEATTVPTEPTVPEDTAVPTEPSVPEDTTVPTEPTVPESSTDSTEPENTDNPTEPDIILTYMLGDVNCDGVINVKDATEIQKAIADLVTLSTAGKFAADVDGSGTIDVKDATAIQKWIAGLENKYPIGTTYTLTLK